MMILKYMDLHVAGEPFRLIIDGFPEIQGTTIAEKRAFAMEHLDGLRRLVLLEPRGHDDMYGGFLLPPVNEDSDLGVVFMHGTGMSTMCGHGVIALTRAIYELGMIPQSDGSHSITADVPSGRVRLSIAVKNGKPGEIALRNDLAFSYLLDAQIETSSYGNLQIDIGYGGAFMVFARIEQFGIPLTQEKIPAMLDISMECGRCAIEQIHMEHPEKPEFNARDNGICMILYSLDSVCEEEIKSRTFTVFGKRQFDRSPTGTGTSALAAVLHAKGMLHRDMRLINRGISGIPFTVAIEEADGGVIPTIYSNAYLTGKGSILLEDEDPLAEGFSVRSNGGEEI